MLINCDLGEGFGAWTMAPDKALMPHIQMANLACGFHAGDAEIMAQRVDWALAQGVRIGAHVSYPDLAGFGHGHYLRPVSRSFNGVSINTAPCMR